MLAHSYLNPVIFLQITQVKLLLLISIFVFTVDDGNTRVGDDISMNNVTFSSYLVFKTLSKCKLSRSLDPDVFFYFVC